MKRKLFIAAIASLMLAAAALAHHSFAAEYDSKKPVELKGTLIELEWVNPHAWIHMEVKDDNGVATKRNCELGSPNLLMRNGWRRDSIQVEIDHEPVSHAGFVWRAIFHGDAGHERRLKPAAMLIGRL